MERYLGLPNMVERNKKTSFQMLKDRLEQKVFIKAMLQPISTYSTVCFLLLNLALFWWQKGQGSRNIHWCSGDQLSISKECEGTSFRKFFNFNVSLLAKQWWQLLNFQIPYYLELLKLSIIHTQIF